MVDVQHFLSPSPDTRPTQVVAVKVAVGYAPEEGDEDEEEAMAALEVRCHHS